MKFVVILDRRLPERLARHTGARLSCRDHRSRTVQRQPHADPESSRSHGADPIQEPDRRRYRLRGARRHLPGVSATKQLALICAALVISSCLTPHITRRYRTQTQTAVAAGQIEATLGAFAMPVPAASVKATLTNLSERAQASLIRELGRALVLPPNDTPLDAAAL